MFCIVPISSVLLPVWDDKMQEELEGSYSFSFITSLLLLL